MSSLNIFFYFETYWAEIVKKRKDYEIKLIILKVFSSKQNSRNCLKEILIFLRILSNLIQIHDFSVIKHGWQFFQAAKIISTCSSNYCFTVPLLNIKHVNADPRGNSLFGFVGDENRDENGSFVDCITL